MSEAHFEMLGSSDTGRVRRSNQDSFALLPESGIAMLADGLGGHASGDLASALAVSTVAQSLHAAPRGEVAASPGTFTGRLHDAVAQANRVLVETAAAAPVHFGMGTTLLVAGFAAETMLAAHVGDSRLYRLRDRALEQLSTDHTLQARCATRDTPRAADSPVPLHGNLLTRALGMRPAPLPDILRAEVRPDDLFLLCSDGLSSMLEPADIRLTLVSFGANLGDAVQRLVALANARGGVDNTTVVLVRQESQAGG